jgi:cellulose 1,4-beta-cellobiosidase
MLYKLAIATAIVAVSAQKPGSLKQEKHPDIQTSTCTKSGGCQQKAGKIVVDENWRWIHAAGKPKDCYHGNQWDPTLCPDPTTCAQNCVLEGADEEYTDTYGITAQGNSLDLKFVTQGPYSKNIGSRTFLMQDDENYQMFKLKNREFTFDVDVSNLPCGLNGALYFVQMDQDGGLSRFPGNTAGAKLGTGYCDAQCPHDLKFINGEPNLLDWVPSKTDPNAGTGKYGTCCVEMDVWEANSISEAYTAHSCAVKEQTRCEGVDCGDTAKGDRFKGVCDKNGCDFQTYRLGNTTFWGSGSNFAIDTTKPMTVVTQFVTADGTDTGALKEIRRFYKQGSWTFQTPTLAVGGSGSFNSLSTDYCTAEAKYFDDGTNFLQKGGMASMDDAMEKGMVLVMSLWDDHEANMLWLDSTYPVNGTAPGDARGTCSTSSGVPKDVEQQHPNAHVTYSNIRFGEIGSTVPSGPPSPPGPPGPSPPGPPSGCPGGSLSACIALCPSTPPAAYQDCVKECVARCSSQTKTDLLTASATDGSCKPWGMCAKDACCPTGWQCTARSGGALKQCAPSMPLVEAFMATGPSTRDVEKFMTNGTTHFPASGLGV